MTKTPIPGARDYAVRVDYLSGGDLFAAETFRLAVAEHEDIHVLASKLVVDSTYSNERVPDLVCIVVIDPIGPRTPTVRRRAGPRSCRNAPAAATTASRATLRPAGIERTSAGIC